MQGIYKITNNVNHKLYIGKTNHSERRWKDHCRLAFKDNHKEYNKALYQAMRKYGLENFSFEIIEELKDYSISGEREQYWIQYYDSYNNGYNETTGGDGGSQKGHCQGELNGRAKLTQEDVIQIRIMYNQGRPRQECYELFKDKVSLSAFGMVWRGQTWKHILPEVFTDENKQNNLKNGRSLGGKKNRKFSDEQVKDIRKRKHQGESNNQVFQDYCHIGFKSSFDGIWYYRTYLDVEE